MAVRQRLRAAERRVLILDAAASVFGEKGYEAARMEDVAEHAGVAKGLLYKHFPSKDALFEALLDAQGARFADELAQVLEDDAGDVEVKDALMRALDLWIRQVSDPTRLRFTDPGAHDAYEAVRDRVREIVASIITRVEPRVPDGAAWLVAAALQGAAESAGIAWSKRPGGLTPEQAAGLLAAFCWEGLAGLRRAIPPA